MQLFITSFQWKAIGLILLSLWIIPQGFSQNTGSINGKITTQEGAPLANVNVVLLTTNKGAISDKNGAFTIAKVAPGNYILQATSMGFETLDKTVTVTNGAVTSVELSIKPQDIMLSEIVIKGDAFAKANETGTVNELALKQIKMLNITEPARMVEQIPGVDLGAYKQGGVADVFSIRGFGGGGHEGQAGVQLDGISLNEAEGHSDGYADMNILIPLNIQKVKVYKGPSSVLYGRFAEGGTLAFETRKGGDYQDVQLTGGSFNTFDAQAAFGKTFLAADKKLTTNFAVQLFNTSGYAANSDYLKGNVSGRIGYQLTRKTDVALTLQGHSSNWDAPGYIPEVQFNNPDLRNQQGPNAENDGGSKRFTSQRIDVNHNLNENVKLLVFGYSVQQDFTRFAKFGFTPGGQSERFNTREVYSTGASLNGKSKLVGLDFDWVGGAEYYDETTFRQRWSSDNRVRQAQTQERTFTVQSVSAFAKGELNVSKYFRPSVGLRYDTYLGEFNNADPGTEGFTRELNALSNVAPKLGVRSTLFTGFDLRANVSNGFSLPNSTTKYDPDLNLEPVQIWQYEVGANYQYKEWLTLDVAGYVLNTSREILENPPGSGDLVNAGLTQRRGIETELNLIPISGLSILGSFTYMETEILENPDVTLVGNELTNIPATIFFTNVVYTLKNGLGTMVRVRDVGAYTTNATNTASYEGYTVAHLMLFYNFDGRLGRRGRVFIEANNITNVAYAETVFGDAGSQSFAPAPLTNFTVGVSYSF